MINIILIVYLPINIILVNMLFPKYQTHNPDNERKLPKGIFCSFLSLLVINPIIENKPARLNAK